MKIFVERKGRINKEREEIKNVKRKKKKKEMRKVKKEGNISELILEMLSVACLF